MSWNLLGYFPHEFTAVTRTVFADGSVNSRGQWVPGAPTVDPHFMIVKPQPVTGDELRMLREGEEGSEFLMSYSHVEVQVRKNKADSDELIWKGKNYKVVKVVRRETGGFWRFVMARIEGQV